MESIIQISTHEPSDTIEQTWFYRKPIVYTHEAIPIRPRTLGQKPAH